MANNSVIYSAPDPMLRLDGQGRIKILINEYAVMASIESIVKTSFGERVWLFGFASSGKGYLFESNNDKIVSELTKDLLTIIPAHDTRPEIISLNFSRDRAAGLFFIKLSMTIKGLTGIFSQTITLTR